MGRRLQLHEKLCAALGTRNVYYEPPDGLRMIYPCIVYQKSGIDTDYAGNRPYKHADKYSVTVIETDPDSTLPSRISEMPTCRHNRRFTSENLIHDVFTITY